MMAHPSTSRAFGTALRAFVTLGALWLILRSLDLTTLFDLVTRANPLWLLGACAVLIVQLGVMAWRWQILIAMLGNARVHIGLG